MTLNSSGTSPEIITRRLRLRRWKKNDLEGLAQINSDSRVMEFYPSLLSREECEAGIIRMETHFEKNGFGFWAVELEGVAAFIGFAGLSILSLETPFTPCVEVGWKLAFPFWGNGFATEAGLAALEFGFEQIGLSEIVAFTALKNFRSRRVMEKLGMKFSPSENFEHPAIPPGHQLRPHVLYRLRGGEFSAGRRFS